MMINEYEATETTSQWKRDLGIGSATVEVREYFCEVMRKYSVTSLKLLQSAWNSSHYLSRQAV